jgi:hypothetical protein
MLEHGFRCRPLVILTGNYFPRAREWERTESRLFVASFEPTIEVGGRERPREEDAPASQALRMERKSSGIHPVDVRGEWPEHLGERPGLPDAGVAHHQGRHSRVGPIPRAKARSSSYR